MFILSCSCVQIQYNQSIESCDRSYMFVMQEYNVSIFSSSFKKGPHSLSLSPSLPLSGIWSLHPPLPRPATLLPSLHLCLPHCSVWWLLCLWLQEGLQHKGGPVDQIATLPKVVATVHNKLASYPCSKHLFISLLIAEDLCSYMAEKPARMVET